MITDDHLPNKSHRHLLNNGRLMSGCTERDKRWLIKLTLTLTWLKTLRIVTESSKMVLNVHIYGYIHDVILKNKKSFFSFSFCSAVDVGDMEIK